MTRLPRPLLLLVLLCLALPHALAQSYTSVLVFGDSLSDAGNVAHLTQSQYGTRFPSPLFGYTDGSFTDGHDTLPPATLYTGVWIQQLAATFPSHPAVVDSLDGGGDYAFGDATTATGTTTASLGTGLSVNVDNLNQQVTDYLSAHTAIPANTLVVVWAGANDLLAATSQADIATAANNELTAVQRLVAAGATDIMVANLPPLGAIPRLNTNPTLAAQATAGAQAFNGALADSLSQLHTSTPSLHLFPLDIYTLFSTVIASPSTYNLANVTLESQAQTVNPDTYLFWDDLHPTTTGHHLIAQAAATLLTAPVLIPTTTVLTATPGVPGLSGQASFSATVTAAAGTAAPTGTITFFDGTTSLGTGTLAASAGGASTATLSTAALFVGTHTLTAVYSGDATFAASTSAVVTLNVLAPSVTVTASPTTVTVTAGSTGTSTLTVTPTNGFSGSVTIACGNLPANTACTVNDTPPVSFSTAQNFTVTFTTNGTTPPQPASLLPWTLSSPFGLLSLLALPGLAVLPFARRRLRRYPTLLVLVVALSSLSLLGLAGCGGSGHNAPRGTYTVPITVTPTLNSTTGSPTTLNLTLVVQ